jgi:hypothetical protein
MTPREFLALKMVWAQKEANFHNAHFRPSDDVPFLPEDFINPNARVERKAKAMKDKAEVMLEQSRMELLQRGSTAGVPEAFVVIGKVN